jgi:hypothetical protein
MAGVGCSSRCHNSSSRPAHCHVSVPAWGGLWRRRLARGMVGKVSVGFCPRVNRPVELDPARGPTNRELCESMTGKRVPTAHVGQSSTSFCRRPHPPETAMNR